MSAKLKPRMTRVCFNFNAAFLVLIASSIISQYSPFIASVLQTHPIEEGPQDPLPLQVTPFLSHMTLTFEEKSV